jgi:hypothetical protein
VCFTTCSLLVQALLVAKRDLKLSRVLKRLASFEVLLIDDLGYVQQSRDSSSRGNRPAFFRPTREAIVMVYSRVPRLIPLLSPIVGICNNPG